MAGGALAPAAKRQSVSAHHHRGMRRDASPSPADRAWPAPAFLILLLHAISVHASPQQQVVCKVPKSHECLIWFVDFEKNVDDVINLDTNSGIAKICYISDLKLISPENEIIMVRPIVGDGPKRRMFCKTISIMQISANEWSTVEKAFESAYRVRRDTSYSPRGRYRGQTQSQYLAIDRGSGKDEGKAEAHSAADSSRATVSGNSGMGQAQSQSMYDPSCEDCVGRPDSAAASLRKPGQSSIQGGTPENYGSTGNLPGNYVRPNSFQNRGNGIDGYGYNPNQQGSGTPNNNYNGNLGQPDRNSVLGNTQLGNVPSRNANGGFDSSGPTGLGFNRESRPYDVNQMGRPGGNANGGMGSNGIPGDNGMIGNKHGGMPTGNGGVSPTFRPTFNQGVGGTYPGSGITPGDIANLVAPGHNSLPSGNNFGRGLVPNGGSVQHSGPGQNIPGSGGYQNAFPGVGPLVPNQNGLSGKTGTIPMGSNWPSAGTFTGPDGVTYYCCTLGPNNVPQHFKFGETNAPYIPGVEGSQGSVGTFRTPGVGNQGSVASYIPGLTGVPGLAGKYTPGAGGNQGSPGPYSPGLTGQGAPITYIPGLNSGQGPVGPYNQGVGGDHRTSGAYGPGVTGGQGPEGPYTSGMGGQVPVGSYMPGTNGGQVPTRSYTPGIGGGQLPTGSYTPGLVGGGKGPSGSYMPGIGGGQAPTGSYTPDLGGGSGPTSSYTPEVGGGQRPIGSYMPGIGGGPGSTGSYIPGSQGTTGLFTPGGISQETGGYSPKDGQVPGGSYGLGSPGSVGSYTPGGVSQGSSSLYSPGSAGTGGTYSPESGGSYSPAGLDSGRTYKLGSVQGLDGIFNSGGDPKFGGSYNPVSGHGLSDPGGTGLDGSYRPGAHQGTGGSYSPGGALGPGTTYGPGSGSGTSGLYGPADSHGSEGSYRPGTGQETGGPYGQGGGPRSGGSYIPSGVSGPGGPYGPESGLGMGELYGPGAGGRGPGGSTGTNGLYAPENVSGPSGAYGPGTGSSTAPGGQGTTGLYNPGSSQVSTGPYSTAMGNQGLGGPYAPGTVDQGSSRPYMPGEIGTGKTGTYTPGAGGEQGSYVPGLGGQGTSRAYQPGVGGGTVPGGTYNPGADGAQGQGGLYGPGGIGQFGTRGYDNNQMGQDGYNGVPQNVIDPNSIADGDDSEAEASVSQAANGTIASASSRGGNDKGRAQTNVHGTYTGSGTFAAQAEITGENKAANSQVAGDKKGASSNAQGSGRTNKSQANVKLGSETGSVLTGSQSEGILHSSNTQVQGSVKGGMADAQARGPGSTSSQAQIGFTPYKDGDKSRHDVQKTPFVGGGVASAQSSGRIGKTQSQLHGTFKYGITYNGAAQAGASLDKDAVFPDRLPFDKIDVFDKNNTNIDVDAETEKPTSYPSTSTLSPKTEVAPMTEIPFETEFATDINKEEPIDNSENVYDTHSHNDHHKTDDSSLIPSRAPPVESRRSLQPTYSTNNADYEYSTDKDYNNNNPPEDYDVDDGFGAEGNEPTDTEQSYDVNTNYNEFSRVPEATHQSLHSPKRKGIEVRQTTAGNTQHIVLGSLGDQDAEITQRNSEHPDESRVYQPGERVPGTGGYTIPIGFTGSVKSVASKDKTYVVGSKESPSQAQTVSLSPGSGKVKYKHPAYGRNVNPKNLRSLSHSKPDDNNRYVSVSKSVTRDLDGENNIRKQYSHTYYTKSSSCGYFTFTCTMVSSAEGKKKVCKPKIPTNPDGTPMRC